MRQAVEDEVVKSQIKVDSLKVCLSVAVPEKGIWRAREIEECRDI